MAYLRLVTDPAILPRPLSPTEAITNVEQLVGLPHARVEGEAGGFWSHYRSTGAYMIAALLFMVGVRRMRSPETAGLENDQTRATLSGRWALAMASKSSSWVMTGRPYSTAVAAMRASVSLTAR